MFTFSFESLVITAFMLAGFWRGGVWLSWTCVSNLWWHRWRLFALLVFLWSRLRGLAPVLPHFLAPSTDIERKDCWKGQLDMALFLQLLFGIFGVPEISICLSELNSYIPKCVFTYVCMQKFYKQHREQNLIYSEQKFSI